MCKMPDSHSRLFLHICEERPFIIDLESKDAMLVRKGESGAEDS